MAFYRKADLSVFFFPTLQLHPLLQVKPFPGEWRHKLSLSFSFYSGKEIKAMVGHFSWKWIWSQQKALGDGNCFTLGLNCKLSRCRCFKAGLWNPNEVTDLGCCANGKKIYTYIFRQQSMIEKSKVYALFEDHWLIACSHDLFANLYLFQLELGDTLLPLYCLVCIFVSQSNTLTLLKCCDHV